jgi:hypothetical protein
MVQAQRWLQTAVMLLGSASCTTEDHPRDVDVYCKLIDSKIPYRISYPGSWTYNESRSSYYSVQESELRPGYIFRPRDAEAVSQFMKLVTSPRFAVRSGGQLDIPRLLTPQMLVEALRLTYAP